MRSLVAGLGALCLAVALPAGADGPGRVPLEDLLQLLVVDRELVALDASGGGRGRTERLRIGENLLERSSRGRVGVALTDQRILAVTASSASWQTEDYHLRERVIDGPFLGDRVALLITNRRVVGFDGGSGNLVERSLGPQERVVARAIGANVAVAVTDRRAMGVSPFRGGFFEIDLRPNETFEGVEAAANLATLRTSRRLLTFRAPSGLWSERRTGIGN
ncbi:MAG: hypothetical protein QNK05_21920 [Myxococcota bacterium]|nr:hypothetical protein [Myxococcota bacterium]